MGKRPAYKYPLVEILWIDAESGDTEWTTPEEIDVDLPEVTSIGFLVKETDTTFVIASTISQDHINGQFKIPKGMVKSKRVLTITTKKAKQPTESLSLPLPFDQKQELTDTATQQNMQ